jgi:hypothetical protein
MMQCKATSAHCRWYLLLLSRREMMDAKPTKIPTPDTVQCPDADPTAVEFLATELPEHVRAFFDEQRKAATSK